jgi:hypothetical protein
MRQISSLLFAGLGIAGMASSAFAGTTTIDFTQDIGNLVRLGASGTLTTDVDCRAVLAGSTTWVVGNGASPVTSGGTSSITVGITPASNLTISQEFGLILVDPDTQDVVTAVVDQNGNVSLSNGFETDTAFFTAPAAANAAFTLTYNQTTDTATLTIAGASNFAEIQPAFPLGEGGPIQIGVFTTSGAKFRTLTATGAGIPNLTSTGTCGAEEGEEEGEGVVEGEPEEGEVTPEILAVGGGFIESGQRLELTLIGDEGAVGYQWTKGHVDIPGENNATLVRDPVNSGDEGVYRCEVDLGAKVVVVSEPVLVDVVPIGGLPVGGGLGMATLAGVLAALGLARSRRR